MYIYLVDFKLQHYVQDSEISLCTKLMIIGEGEVVQKWKLVFPKYTEH